MAASGVRMTRLNEAEFLEFRRAFSATFGNEPPEPFIRRRQRTFEFDRGIVGRNDLDEIVATGGAYSFEMSVPGGASVGCAGITVISVRQDHRRRGLLSQMVDELIRDARDRDEPVAALWASESSIYGRFGFGPAVPILTLTVDRAYSALRREPSMADVRLVGPDEAATTFPAIHERWRQQRGGLLARSSLWWERILEDHPEQREGASPYRHALLGDRGYATFRLRPSWTDDAPDGTVQLAQLVALDPDATASLWRFVFETDLAVRLSVQRVPVDEPLLSLLVDPGRARVQRGGALYLRLIDAPAAFAARTYLGEGDIVFDLDDSRCPSNAGTWRLVVRDGAGTLEPAPRETPELHLDAEAIGSVYLGGVRATQLLLAGQITGSLPAAARLDHLLHVDLAPMSDLHF